jgi:hypothetical protein
VRKILEGIETIYVGGRPPVTYTGLGLNEEFIIDYIPSRVKDRILDTQGTEEISQEFEDLTKTGFEKEKLSEIFNLDERVKFWKIGESLAECYLEDYEGIRFPYNYIRDAKNPKANLTGADLVGFVDINSETVFLFGEVKTSNDKSSPPTVLYGRSGMIKQLEKIKIDPNVKNYLVRWLAFKVKNLSDGHPFKKDYKKALKIYIQSNKTRVVLIGVLVRDTPPTEKDLLSRYEELKIGLQNRTNIKLIALYMSISLKELENLIYGGENIGA